jgi:biotin operon repressor
MTSKFIPNAYQTPNAYADELMAYLTPEEWMVLSYAIRRIFGFNKRQDRISKRQFMTGTVDENGEHLDRGTGLGEAAVTNALKSLKDYGILIFVDENDPDKNEGRLYALQMESDRVDIDGLRKRREEKQEKANQRMNNARANRKEQPAAPAVAPDKSISAGLPDKDTPPLLDKDTPPLSNRLNNIQDKQDKQGVRAVPAAPAVAPDKSKTDPRSKHPAILCVKGITGHYPPKVNYDEVITILGDSPDGQKAAKIYKLWTFGGRNARGLGWLEWYRDGVPDYAGGPRMNGNHNGNGKTAPRPAAEVW